MYTICPLSAIPDARPICIGWTDAEWRDDTGFTLDDWDAEFQRVEDDPVDEIFIALKDNVPVGMAWMLEHEDPETLRHLTPWLSSVIVSRDHREKGVARALLKHVEAYAAGGGDEHIFLLTVDPGYYFAQKWEVVETTHLGERRVFVMRKDIRTDAAERSA